jgi:Na+/proline symporter
MVGGSIGTALLNTLAASAAASYLAGRALDPADVQAAQLHGYTTAFLWCALVFAAAALVAAVVLPPGNLKALLAPQDQIAPAEPGSGEAPRAQLCRIRIACR